MRSDVMPEPRLQASGEIQLKSDPTLCGFGTRFVTLGAGGGGLCVLASARSRRLMWGRWAPTQSPTHPHSCCIHLGALVRTDRQPRLASGKCRDTAACLGRGIAAPPPIVTREMATPYHGQTNRPGPLTHARISPICLVIRREPLGCCRWFTWPVRAGGREGWGGRGRRALTFAAIYQTMIKPSAISAINRPYGGAWLPSRCVWVHDRRQVRRPVRPE